jgi:hypothetical protein
MHPALQVVHETGDPLLPHGATLIGRQTIDGALGVEDRIDPADRLDRQRRLGQFRQFEEVAPPMRPAQRLDQRRRLPCSAIQIIEAGIPSLRRYSYRTPMLPIICCPDAPTLDVP